MALIRALQGSSARSRRKERGGGLRNRLIGLWVPAKPSIWGGWQAVVYLARVSAFAVVDLSLNAESFLREGPQSRL